MQHERVMESSWNGEMDGQMDVKFTVRRIISRHT